MVLKSYLNQKKLRANAQEAIQELTAFLRGKGYVPCCQYCGRETETEGYGPSFAIHGFMRYLGLRPAQLVAYA